MSASASRTEPLKVAVLSSASGGGAGIAARRLTDALNLSEEVQADFLDMVALGERMPDDAAPPGNMSNRKMTDTHFTVEFTGYMRGWIIDLLQDYDVLNIHWASFLLGLAEIDELSRRGMPILFTCHDYYYFTGGCHYPAECNKLAKGCIACPQVNTDYCSPSVISANLKIKKRILSRPNVHLAAPSAFLVNEAVSAGMIASERTHVLRNAYVPVPGVNRQSSNGPPRILLLADSMTERRKAMPLAIEALALAWISLKDKSSASEAPFVVDVIGRADEEFVRAVNRAGFDHVLHGRITEHERIAGLLARCDFLLTCSFEDNWPNVLVEAGSYGVVPIVGPGHGCEEFCRLYGIGEVAQSYSKKAFGDSIVKCVAKMQVWGTDGLIKAVTNDHNPRKIGQEYLDKIKRFVGSTANVASTRLGTGQDGP